MGCCASDDLECHNTDMNKTNRPNDKEIDLSHFRMLGVMGQLMKKNILERSSGPSSVLTELRALAVLDSPFICNCHYAFQNKACLFLVLDLALGGDMRYNLKYAPKNRFPEETAKFFVCQVLLAVDACHRENILHRDIKPENLLMKESGYLMLSDFGISKILADVEDCHGTSGTHGYMAPEIYLPGHVHGTPAQWFAVGVTCHEFVTGRRPFDSTKIKACRRGIDVAGAALTLDFLKSCAHLSVHCKAFISSCLTPQPNSRLGGMYGLREFKCHPWLSDVDWDALATQTMPSPFVPDVSYSRNDLRPEDERRIVEKLSAAEDVPTDVEKGQFARYAFHNRFYKSGGKPLDKASSYPRTLTTQPESGDVNTNSMRWSMVSEMKIGDQHHEGTSSDCVASPNGSQPLRVVTDKRILSSQDGSRSMASESSTHIVRCLGPVYPTTGGARTAGRAAGDVTDTLPRPMSHMSQGSRGVSLVSTGVAGYPSQLQDSKLPAVISATAEPVSGSTGSLILGREIQSNLPVDERGEAKEDGDGPLPAIKQTAVGRVWNRPSASSASIVTEEGERDDRGSLARGVLSVPDSRQGSMPSCCFDDMDVHDKADSPLP